MCEQKNVKNYMRLPTLTKQDKKKLFKSQPIMYPTETCEELDETVHTD
jgi:hypothetical protein